jgi:hypothetical protein
MSRLLWSLGALVVAVTVAEPAWAVVTPVPEPGTMSILGAALAAVAIAARRRR